MNKKILKVTIVAIFALVAGTNVYNALKPESMSDIALANVEALAGSEGGSSDHRYETKHESSIEVWDEGSGTFKKMTTIQCEGRGCLDC